MRGRKELLELRCILSQLEIIIYHISKLQL